MNGNLFFNGSYFLLHHPACFFSGTVFILYSHCLLLYSQHSNYHCLLWKIATNCNLNRKYISKQQRVSFFFFFFKFYSIYKSLPLLLVKNKFNIIILFAAISSLERSLIDVPTFLKILMATSFYCVYSGNTKKTCKIFKEKRMKMRRMNRKKRKTVEMVTLYKDDDDDDGNYPFTYYIIAICVVYVQRIYIVKAFSLLFFFIFNILV